MKILPSMNVFIYPLVIQRFFFSLEEIPKLCLTMCLQNDISLKIQHYENGPIPSLQTNKLKNPETAALPSEKIIEQLKYVSLKLCGGHSF